MSGGFSVPFVAAAVWFDNIYAKLIFACLAFSGALYAAYRIWKAEREKVIGLQKAALDRRQKKQQLLDDISALRLQLTGLRIDMERDIGAKQFSHSHWEQKLAALENVIASKIEAFASKAEADAYRSRGNIQRPLNPMMGGHANPVHVDACIHDLDYLRQFIIDYSRNKERAL
jgi:hypothetical protein